MKFAEYIELLSDSPLTRAKFDALLKKRGIIYEVEEGDEYDQAVMSGHFRGKRSEFQYTKPKKEQSIDAYKGFVKDILAEVEAKADKDHKHDIEDINWLSADLQAISKSINDIDDKHTNKHISYEESQKKYQAEIQSLNDKIKRLYAKPEKDYSISDIKWLQDELTSIQTNIQDASKTITKSIATKSNKDHKHNIKDIEGIDKWAKTIKSDILDEIPTIDEVKQALDNVYIKSEVYNKEEVDNKLKKAVKSVYVTETIGMWWWGGGWWTRGAITGTLSDQTDLQTALDGKANTIHTHSISDITWLQSDLNNKASLTGSYANPSRITSLARSKITSTPTTLSWYGITDARKTTGNSNTNPSTNFIGTTDAQDLIIKAHNTEAIRLFQNGRVGVGNLSASTTTPGAVFTVRAQSNVPAIQVRGYNSGSWPLVDLYSFDQYQANHGINWSGPHGQYFSIIRPSGAPASSALTFNSGFGAPFAFTGGNVGIGTSNPLYKFVISNSNAQGLEFSPTNPTFFDIQAYNRSTSQYIDIKFAAKNFEFNAPGAAIPTMYMTYTGRRVGLGTNTPRAILDIIGSGTSASTYPVMISNSANVNIITARDDGNIGIGTSNPLQKLSVVGTGTAGRVVMITQTATSISTGAYTFEIDSSSHSSNVTWAGAFGVKVYSGMAFVINGLGNIGIGATSPTAKLEVNGSIKLSAGNATYGITLPERGQRITIGTYGTISETLGGAGYITGNNIASSQTLSNTLTKVYSMNDSAQFIGMRYDRGVWFGTGIGAGDPLETTYADSTNTRMVLWLTGNVGIGGTITNFTNMAGASVAIISSNVGVGTNAPTAKVDINSDVLRLRTAKTPATAGASGNQGDISRDSNYIYVCTATDTWKRATLSTW